MNPASKYSLYWDRQFEEGLPDSRRVVPLESDKVILGQMEWTRIYCADCGRRGGAVPSDCPHVFYLCDDCDHKRVVPPGIQVPESVLRFKKD